MFRTSSVQLIETDHGLVAVGPCGAHAFQCTQGRAESDKDYGRRLAGATASAILRAAGEFPRQRPT